MQERFDLEKYMGEIGMHMVLDLQETSTTTLDALNETRTFLDSQIKVMKAKDPRLNAAKRVYSYLSKVVKLTEINRGGLEKIINRSKGAFIFKEPDNGGYNYLVKLDPNTFPNPKISRAFFYAGMLKKTDNGWDEQSIKTVQEYMKSRIIISRVADKLARELDLTTQTLIHRLSSVLERIGEEGNRGIYVFNGTYEALKQKAEAYTKKKRTVRKSIRIPRTEPQEISVEKPLAFIHYDAQMVDAVLHEFDSRTPGERTGALVQVLTDFAGRSNRKEVMPKQYGMIEKALEKCTTYASYVLSVIQCPSPSPHARRVAENFLYDLRKRTEAGGKKLR